VIEFLWLLPCPVAIALSALIVGKRAVLTWTAACLGWIQLAIVAKVWWPYLRESTDTHATCGFRPDGTAAFFILVTTLVACAALTHCIGFFERDAAGAHPPSRRQISQFYFFTPLFVLAMYAVVAADNLGYVWIGVEATTLFSAPLVYYHRSRTSLEATWKYVIICSVGIAFGFFGTAVLYAASQQVGALSGGTLSLGRLTADAAALPPAALRLAFVFMLLGYGTKAGLFPLHSWLPDAHSEAPAPASALLSGSLLNCALVVIWRISKLMFAAGQGLLVRDTLLPMAALTVVAGALFLLKQRDVKRLLAYSSMENVGLMAAAIALGSGSGFALQALNHSLVKVALFLLAGNMLQQCGTKKLGELRGLLTAQPAQAILLLLLVAAVAGTPPFGSFVSEWQILASAADAHRVVVVVAIAGSLAVAFIALSIHISGVIFGKPAKELARGNAVSLVLTPSLLLLATLLLGVMLTPRVLALAAGVAR
jgi:hydrogenase-4 component F